MKQQSAPDLSLFSSRLRHLHNIISLVPDEQFDLIWYSELIDGCGTIGCALGWATQDSAFQALGLQTIGENSWEPSYLGLESGLVSTMAFFGMNYAKCSNLFTISAYSEWDPNTTSHGKYRQEFLDRLEKQIEEMKVKEIAA